jgi:hypothetical protein
MLSLMPIGSWRDMLLLVRILGSELQFSKCHPSLFIFLYDREDPRVVPFYACRTLWPYTLKC